MIAFDPSKVKPLRKTGSAILFSSGTGKKDPVQSNVKLEDASTEQTNTQTTTPQSTPVKIAPNTPPRKRTPSQPKVPSPLVAHIHNRRSTTNNVTENKTLFANTDNKKRDENNKAGAKPRMRRALSEGRNVGLSIKRGDNSNSVFERPQLRKVTPNLPSNNPSGSASSGIFEMPRLRKTGTNIYDPIPHEQDLNNRTNSNVPAPLPRANNNTNSPAPLPRTNNNSPNNNAPAPLPRTTSEASCKGPPPLPPPDTVSSPKVYKESPFPPPFRVEEDPDAPSLPDRDPDKEALWYAMYSNNTTDTHNNNNANNNDSTNHNNTSTNEDDNSDKTTPKPKLKRRSSRTKKGSKLKLKSKKSKSQTQKNDGNDDNQKPPVKRKKSQRQSWHPTTKTTVSGTSRTRSSTTNKDLNDDTPPPLPPDPDEYALSNSSHDPDDSISNCNSNHSSTNNSNDSSSVNSGKSESADSGIRTKPRRTKSFIWRNSKMKDKEKSSKASPQQKRAEGNGKKQRHGSMILGRFFSIDSKHKRRGSTHL